MNPISIGTNTHAAHGARHGHGAHGKSHGAHEKSGSNPFESSLEGALADDDASKLGGDTTEEDKKKSALGAGPHASPQPSNLAAALAFTVAATPVDAAETATDAGAATDAKRGTTVAGVDLHADAKLEGAAGADDAPRKALAPTKTLAEITRDLPADALGAMTVASGAQTAPPDAAMTLPVGLPTVPGPTPPALPPATPGKAAAMPPVGAASTVPLPAAALAVTAEAVAKPVAKAETERATATRPAATATEAVTSAPAKVYASASSRSENDANDPQGSNTADPRASAEKPAATTLAKADKRAKLSASASVDDDMSADAARVTATIADPKALAAPVGLSTDTAKTVTAGPSNRTDATNAAENTIRSNSEVDARTDQTIKAAEAAGHKRTLASGEASGQLVTPELGRVEVMARTIDAGHVEVHVRAVEEHAKQVIAANAESLREHVRVEVPNAIVHVQKPSNDLLGNGSSGRDLGNQGAASSARDGGGRDGRGDAPSGNDSARDASVKSPAVPVKGARVRFVL